MEKEKTSVLIHSGTGVITGFLSAFLGRPLYALLSAIFLLYGTGKATELLAEREGFKWWLGNGVVPFIFIWLISWVFLYNV